MAIILSPSRQQPPAQISLGRAAQIGKGLLAIGESQVRAAGIKRRDVNRQAELEFKQADVLREQGEGFFNAANQAMKIAQVAIANASSIKSFNRQTGSLNKLLQKAGKVGQNPEQGGITAEQVQQELENLPFDEAFRNELESVQLLEQNLFDQVDQSGLGFDKQQDLKKLFKNFITQEEAFLNDVNTIGQKIFNDVAAGIEDEGVRAAFQQRFAPFIQKEIDTQRAFKAVEKARRIEGAVQTSLSNLADALVNDPNKLESYETEANKVLDENLASGVLSPEMHARLADEFRSTTRVGLVRKFMDNQGAQATLDMLERPGAELGLRLNDSEINMLSREAKQKLKDEEDAQILAEKAHLKEKQLEQSKNFMDISLAVREGNLGRQDVLREFEEGRLKESDARSLLDTADTLAIKKRKEADEENRIQSLLKSETGLIGEDEKTRNKAANTYVKEYVGDLKDPLEFRKLVDYHAFRQKTGSNIMKAAIETRAVSEDPLTIMETANAVHLLRRTAPGALKGIKPAVLDNLEAERNKLVYGFALDEQKIREQRDVRNLIDKDTLSARETEYGKSYKNVGELRSTLIDQYLSEEEHVQKYGAELNRDEIISATAKYDPKALAFIDQKHFDAHQRGVTDDEALTQRTLTDMSQNLAVTFINNEPQMTLQSPGTVLGLTPQVEALLPYIEARTEGSALYNALSNAGVNPEELKMGDLKFHSQGNKTVLDKPGVKVEYEANPQTESGLIYSIELPNGRVLTDYLYPGANMAAAPDGIDARKFQKLVNLLDKEASRSLGAVIYGEEQGLIQKGTDRPEITDEQLKAGLEQFESQDTALLQNTPRNQRMELLKRREIQAEKAAKLIFNKIPSDHELRKTLLPFVYKAMKESGQTSSVELKRYLKQRFALEIALERLGLKVNVKDLIGRD